MLMVPCGCLCTFFTTILYIMLFDGCFIVFGEEVSVSERSCADVVGRMTVTHDCKVHTKLKLIRMSISHYVFLIMLSSF